VERLLSPLAHEGRVTILQALYAGPLGSTALTETTGFEGGRLYHHLRELRYAGYVTQEQGKYRLTQLGRELLITVTLIAEQAIVDRGEEGLAAGEAWVGQ
jgi:predicted transcriptional regulator